VNDTPGAGPQLSGGPDRWAKFRGLAWWQLLLTLLPLLLLPLGGLIGGLIGAAAAFANASVARKPLATPLKAAAMIGVTLAAYVVFIVLAALVLGVGG
jgi:hypothetical protein